MAMQRRGKQRQGDLWVATNQIVQTPGHAFYDRLNVVLKEADFDRWIEDRCRKLYVDGSSTETSIWQQESPSTYSPKGFSFTQVEVTGLKLGD